MLSNSTKFIELCSWMKLITHEILPNGRNMIINAFVFMLEFDHIDQCKIKFDTNENDPQYQ